MLTPLLESGIKISASNDCTSPVGSVVSDPSSALYAGTVSNNNEWKDNGESNILKIGYVHNSAHQSNNNGSLTNGKNGIGLSDKYDEHDPLTGLYK